MIEKALVSGQIAQAIFQDDERLFIINADDIDRVLDCTPYEESLFFNSEAEIRIFENITIEELKDILLKEKMYFDALYGAIGGMDKDLSEETRILSIQRAENLIEDPEIFDFVTSRFFGNPVPKEADLEKAVELCIEEDIHEMRFIYAYLFYGKDVIDRILQVFRETIFEFEAQSEYVKIKNLFISTGLFAKLFFSSIDRDLKSLKRLAFDYEPIIKLQDKESRISNTLARIISRLMEGITMTEIAKIWNPVFEEIGGEFEIEGKEVKTQCWFVRDKKGPYNKKKKH